jgi:5-formyltetrahydrofolate cyclo-ligase
MRKHPEPLSRDRADIVSWRKLERATLLRERTNMSLEYHRRYSAGILGRLAPLMSDVAAKIVGFYWPFRREINLLPFVEGLMAKGAKAALPVVVEKAKPLEFRLWEPGDPMEPGPYNIPQPAQGAPVVQPECLLVSLVGFDGAGFRLGYGGGYYDRTLAATRSRPRTIGVGFECARLSTIHPLDHDIPMDVIVTEREIFERARA